MKRTAILLLCALLATACAAYLGYLAYQFEFVQEMIADRSFNEELLAGLSVESFTQRAFENDAFVWVAACLCAALGALLIWIGWARSNRGLTVMAMLVFGLVCWMTYERYYLSAPVIALAFIGCLRVSRIRRDHRSSEQFLRDLELRRGGVRTGAAAAQATDAPAGADPIRVLLVLLLILTMLATAAAVVYGIKYT